MITCTKCNQPKENTQFSKHSRSKSGFKSQCKNCVSESEKARYELNKEAVAAKRKEKRVLENPDSKGRGRWGARTQEDLPDVFSYEERQVLIGSLLGDGSLTMWKRAVTPVYRERHADNQEAYIRWKADVLNRLKPRIVEHYAKLGDNKFKGWFLSTPSVPALHEFMCFYDGKTKVVPQLALDELDALSLAVWCQDDGSLIKARENIGGVNPAFIIFPRGFTLEENISLRNALRKLLNTSKVSVIQAINGNGIDISLGVEATRNMAELCAPYWHSSMAYKFTYPELLKKEAV